MVGTDAPDADVARGARRAARSAHTTPDAPPRVMTRVLEVLVRSLAQPDNAPARPRVRAPNPTERGCGRSAARVWSGDRRYGRQFVAVWVRSARLRGVV